MKVVLENNDQSKFCNYYHDNGQAIEDCRSSNYFIEKLVKDEYLTDFIAHHQKNA